MPLKPAHRPRLALVPPPPTEPATMPAPPPIVVDLPRPIGGYDARSRGDAHRAVDAALRAPRPVAKAADPDAPPYVTLCISTYPRDLAKLDAMVAELKRRGFTKANRSALIRVALDQLDLDKVPRGI